MANEVAQNLALFDNAFSPVTNYLDRQLAIRMKREQDAIDEQRQIAREQRTFAQQQALNKSNQDFQAGLAREARDAGVAEKKREETLKMRNDLVNARIDPSKMTDDQVMAEWGKLGTKRMDDAAGDVTALEKENRQLTKQLVTQLGSGNVTLPPGAEDTAVRGWLAAADPSLVAKITSAVQKRAPDLYAKLNSPTSQLTFKDLQSILTEEGKESWWHLSNKEEAQIFQTINSVMLSAKQAEEADGKKNPKLSAAMATMDEIHQNLAQMRDIAKATPGLQKRLMDEKAIEDAKEEAARAASLTDLERVTATRVAVDNARAKAAAEASNTKPETAPPITPAAGFQGVRAFPAQAASGLSGLWNDAKTAASIIAVSPQVQDLRKGAAYLWGGQSEADRVASGFPQEMADAAQAYYGKLWQPEATPAPAASYWNQVQPAHQTLPYPTQTPYQPSLMPTAPNVIPAEGYVVRAPDWQQPAPNVIPAEGYVVPASGPVIPAPSWQQGGPAFTRIPTAQEIQAYLDSQGIR